MGVDATIALSVRDNLSEAIVGMRNSLTAFRTDIPRLQEELDRLNATRVQMRMDLSQARREVQLAQRAFEALGDSVSEAERQAAEADWRTAEENLQNLQQQYDLVSRQVRQTTRDMENASGAIRRNENRADNGTSGMTRRIIHRMTHRIHRGLETCCPLLDRLVCMSSWGMWPASGPMCWSLPPPAAMRAPCFPAPLAERAVGRLLELW